MKKFYTLALVASIIAGSMTFAQQAADTASAANTESWATMAQKLYDYIPESWRGNFNNVLDEIGKNSSVTDTYQQLAEQAKKLLTPEQQEQLKQQVWRLAQQYFTSR